MACLTFNDNTKARLKTFQTGFLYHLPTNLFFLNLLGKVVQGTDQLAGVRHFVIVPSNGFHHLFVTDGLYAGLGRVKQ